MILLDIQKLRKRLRIWSEDLERVPVIGKVVKKSKTWTLPGFQHLPLYDVMDYFFQSLGKGVIFQRAAALTYRIFIALVPMIIALFSVIAFLGEGVQQTLISLLQSVIPVYAWPAVEDVITGVVTVQNGTLSLLMLFFGLYFGIICCNGLLAALNTSYFNDQKRNIIKQLLLSLHIMLMVFVTVLVVVALMIIASVVMNRVHAKIGAPVRVYFFLVHGVKWILIFAALYFVVSMLYYLAPVNKQNYRFFSAGSSVCTFLLVVILWALNFYFSHFSNYNLIYGSLGAIFAILLWLNWSSLAFLLGYDLNVSIAKAKGEGVERVPTVEEKEEKTT